MPRIRTLKPEFFRSPSTAKVDPLVRLFYQALWCWADDFGIGETNIYGWLGFAFPDGQEIYDPELRGFRALSAQDLRRFCADVARHFEITFYIVRGRHYYAIGNWEQHQKTERREGRRKNPRPDDPEAIPDLQFQDCAESAPICAGKPAQNPRKTGAGTGEQGNRGTGEKDDDSPTNATHHNATTVEAIVVENAAKPARNHPSSAARTVVRQTLGYAGYPRSTIDRLATQVDRLTREGQPDTLIRQALTAWDRRPNCERPEYLPTVLSDVLKASRASPATNGHDDKVNGYLAFANQPRQPEIEP